MSDFCASSDFLLFWMVHQRDQQKPWTPGCWPGWGKGRTSGGFVSESGRLDLEWPSGTRNDTDCKV